MPASLLELCRRVADACNIPRPVAVARAASDPTSRRLLTYAREEIRLLAAAGDWQELRSEATVSLTPGVSSYPLSGIAPDFSRIVEGTCWIRPVNRRLTGPVTPQRWAALMAAMTPGEVSAFRVIGGAMVFFPVPAAAETVTFEYVSSCPVLAADGVTRRETWEDDSDAPMLDDYLIELGMRWRFMASVNMEHAQDRALYEREVPKRLTSGGAPVLSLLPGESVGGFADHAPGVDWRIINLPAGQL